jgi:hypothetical protein
VRLDNENHTKDIDFSATAFASARRRATPIRSSFRDMSSFGYAECRVEHDRPGSWRKIARHWPDTAQKLALMMQEPFSFMVLPSVAIRYAARCR